MRLYDEFTVEVARTLPWTIAEVDRALGILSARGVQNPESARDWLYVVASGKLDFQSVLAAVDHGMTPAALR